MQYTIPQEFKDYAVRLLGPQRWDKLELALGKDPSVSIRLNPFKAGSVDYDQSRFDGEVPWANGAFYLKDRPAFTADPLLHAGIYYVQEAASMFLEYAIRHYVKTPVKALDLCAAPGGKSTVLRASLPEGSFLVCNEPIRQRAQVLAENMVKWGHPDVMVTNSYPDAFTTLNQMFDLVVADVPCSGEGMFRKEEDAVSGWSMENVMMCRDRQREIISQVWPALKSGGLLVYSTCTLNQYENEENVQWIASQLGAEVLPLDVAEEWGICGNLLADDVQAEEAGRIPVCHFIPGLTRGEGFFLAVLRKTSTDEEEADSVVVRLDKKNRNKGKHCGKCVQTVPDICRSWLYRNDDTFDFRVNGSVISAVAGQFSDWCDAVRDKVNVLHCGVTVAEQKGKDWMPSHALAMSLSLVRAAFPNVDLEYEAAVSYLRKEAPSLPEGTPKGFVLLTYAGVPLGFAKNIGQRANNLYPQEWRIRSSFLPDFSIVKYENVHNV